MCFPVEFPKFLRSPSFTKHLRRLLLFLLCYHSRLFYMHAGFVSPSLLAASTRNKAAAMWLQIEPMPPLQIEGLLKYLHYFPLCKAIAFEADLSVFPKVCSLPSENNELILLHGIFFFRASPVQNSFIFVITQVPYVSINHQEVQTSRLHIAVIMDQNAISSFYSIKLVSILD